MPTVYTANSKSAAITKAILGACKPCCGSGSGGGSGGGDAGNCCGCERFLCDSSNNETAFPATLSITMSAACIGSRTITIDREDFDFDNLFGGPRGCSGTATAGDGRRASYAGTFLGTFIEDAWSYNQCDSTATGTGFDYYDEQVSVFVSCCDAQKNNSACEPGTGPDTSEWRLYLFWEKTIAGVRREVFALLTLTLVSCSPLTFTASDTAYCGDLSGIAIGPCAAESSGSGALSLGVRTRSDEAVGCVLQVDIEE